MRRATPASLSASNWNNILRFSAAAIAAAASLVLLAEGPTISNVRGSQLQDGSKKVEVLYDVTGVTAAGATVDITFSQDGGNTYTILPPPSQLSGDVGNIVSSGTNKRIVWDAPSALPVGTFNTNFRAMVTVKVGTIPEEMTVTLPGGVPLAIVKIPAGAFLMGAMPGERSATADESPQHQVTITKEYYIGKYEVTELQWEAIMKTNPASPVGPNYPVNNVSWNDINGSNNQYSFIKKLNEHLTATNQPGAGKFRLPTEAEWEYACRAHTQTRYSFGDKLECGDACEQCDLADQYMWWCGNSSNNQIHFVGTKQPNAFGLYDMHGNVQEMVGDWFGPYTLVPQTDPAGPTTGSTRVRKGGDAWLAASYARSSARSYVQLDNRSYSIGFRVARSL